jgi:hypothetical protein
LGVIAVGIGVLWKLKQSASKSKKTASGGKDKKKMVSVDTNERGWMSNPLSAAPSKAGVRICRVDTLLVADTCVGRKLSLHRVSWLKM